MPRKSKEAKTVVQTKKVEYAKPRNKAQATLLHYLNKENCKIVVASGPAGTGKTLFSVEQGLKGFLNGKYKKIIFTRPTVGVDENIGFLPGSLEEKMLPWMRPIYDIIHNYISQSEIEHLIQEQIIEISPLGFMRGRTFKNCWIVADEMQNSTISQMKMLLTRIGENTRLVVTGDCEQNDLNVKANGLRDFLQKLKGRRSDSIGSVEFENDDIEREPVVKEILEIYETNHSLYYQIENRSDADDSTKETSSDTDSI